HGSLLRELLRPQLSCGGQGGGELLAERLHALALPDRLPARARLLELASPEPVALRPPLGMALHKAGPPTPCLSAQRLRLGGGPGGGSWGEATQGDQAHHALGGRLLVGHATVSFP